METRECQTGGMGCVDFLVVSWLRATDIEHVIFRLQVFIDEHIYHTRQH